jgi:hypothetical protein
VGFGGGSTVDIGDHLLELNLGDGFGFSSGIFIGFES